MPPLDWPIRIDDVDGKTRFVPDRQRARLNDTVSWGDWTDKPHWPWPTREDGTPLTKEEVTGVNARNYLSDKMPARGSSTPTWVAATSTITGSTIYYCCMEHPDDREERGQIVIIE